MDNLSDKTQTAIRKAIAANQKILAIKLYKDATGTDLKSSKDAIESLVFRERDAEHDRISDDSPGVDAAEMELILDAIFQRRKLDAVKQYMTSTGLGLTSSKEFIEDLTEQLKEECPDQFRLASSGRGCASVLLVLVMMGIVFAALLPAAPRKGTNNTQEILSISHNQFDD